MRKQLYLLFFLLAGMSSQGQQNVLATVQLPGAVENAIIREYAYPKTISYIKTTAGCGFAMADNSLILSWASLDCKYEITDFEIRDEIVYFVEQIFLQNKVS